MTAIISMEQIRSDLPALPATREALADAAIPITPRIATLTKTQGTRTYFNDKKRSAEFVEQWVPSAVTEEDIPDLEHQLALLSDALLPSHGDPEAEPALLRRILLLLAPYRDREDLPEDLESGLAEDWAEDLGDFPLWVVEEACRQHRRDPKTYRFRPLPGDIRRRCENIIKPATTLRYRVEQLLAKARRNAPSKQTATLPPPEPQPAALPPPAPNLSIADPLEARIAAAVARKSATAVEAA